MVDLFSSNLKEEQESSFFIDTGVSQNAKDFSKSLIQVAVALESEISTIIMKAVLDLYSTIAMRTPVDKGRARASWQISSEFDSSLSQDENYDDSKTEKNKRAMDVVNTQANKFKFETNNKKIYLYNNLNYIEYLEKGHSKQAGGGMVAISLSEFDVKFQQALKKSRLV